MGSSVARTKIDQHNELVAKTRTKLNGEKTETIQIRAIHMVECFNARNYLPALNCLCLSLKIQIDCAHLAPNVRACVCVLCLCL